MISINPFIAVLENRIRLLLPLGLSSIWLKATGDHDFNMGRVLGFESHEWDLMLNLSGLLKNKRLNYRMWSNIFSDFKVDTTDYRTREYPDQSKWMRFLKIEDWVSILNNIVL
jgi:hypothetical protein